MKPNKPRVARLDEVTIKRDGDTAIITYNDGSCGTVHLTFDFSIDHMTDAQILDRHNEITDWQLKTAADWHPTEIVDGRPQIKFDRHYKAWMSQGHVLRCTVDSNDIYNEPTILIDDHKLSWQQFAQLIAPFNGWGMRIMFVPEDQLSSPPTPELRKAPERISKKELDKIVQQEAARTTRKKIVALRDTANPCIAQAAREFFKEPASKQLTRANRKGAIVLFLDCLNNYGHQTLNKKELKQFEHYCELEEPKRLEFCQIFGPDKIAENVAKFVEYFLIRKVMLSGPDMAETATAVEEFCLWLGKNDWIDEKEANTAAQVAARAAQVLPRAETASKLLWQESQKNYGVATDFIDFQTLTFKRIEGDQAWLITENNQEIGPVPLPKRAAKLIEPNWTINSSLIKAGGKWRLADIGNIYPV